MPRGENYGIVDEIVTKSKAPEKIKTRQLHPICYTEKLKFKNFYLIGLGEYPIYYEVFKAKVPRSGGVNKILKSFYFEKLNAYNGVFL